MGEFKATLTDPVSAASTPYSSSEETHIATLAKMMLDAAVSVTMPCCY